MSNNGHILIKRFADGIGFEILYPIGASEKEAHDVKINFLRCLEDVGEVVEEVIGVIDTKSGYKKKSKLTDR